MANDIDTAAQAFDKEVAAEKPSDTMFPNLGTLEIDEDSPPKGGGDDDEDILYADVPPKKGKEGGDSDEDAGDGDEEGDDTDDGTEDDEEVDEDENAALDAKYKVMVDGEEKEVPLKEALEGYIRTETFHKRLSELGETQQVIQRAAADVVQNFEYSKQLIEVMEGQMAELVPAEPDWDKLFAEDPAKARGLQKYYQQVADFKAKLQEQRVAINKQQAIHDSQQLKAYAEAEELRFARINAKNWGTDPKKKAKDLQSMRRTALQEGFSEDEVNGVYDSRMLNVLLKASKYDRMMAARPKPVRQVAKPVTPGPGNKRTGRKGFSEAMKRLARTGKVDDAAPVFDQILGRR